MGYFIVEKFDDATEWAIETAVHNYYELGETDWPSLISSPDKETGLRVIYDKSLPFTGETFFFKDYAQPIKFVQTDYYDKPVHYPELLLTYLIQGFNESIRAIPRNPDDCYMSFSIYNAGTKLREWYLPWAPGKNNQFIGHCFDLQPLIDAGETEFDRIQVSMTQHGNSARFYFGDLYAIQDEVEHNLAVTLQDMLHCKMKKKLTVTSQNALAGDLSLSLVDLVDIHNSTAIIIGDPDGVYELHVIQNSTYENPDAGGEGQITLTGEFDTSELQYDWPAGTDIWFTVPATMGDLSQSESIFPVFYISWDAPTPTPDHTPGYGRSLDSYVRDRSVDAEDTVGVRLSADTVKILVQIHVFSSTIEIGVEMWRYLRSVFDHQNFIIVAGTKVEYDPVDYRKENPGQDVLETMPHYILDIECWPSENVHVRKYRAFPALKLLTEITSVGIGDSV